MRTFGWSFLSAIFVTGAVLGQNGGTPPTPASLGPKDPAAYAAAQYAALQAMINAASAASATLSGDDLAAWQKARPSLGQAIGGLATAFDAGAFHGKIKIVQGTWPGLEQADTLDRARAAYLKVGDNLAQILLEARQADPRLAKAIVYYCTMTADPANARWIQLAPPLTNPFWGVDMLPCCSEVTP